METLFPTNNLSLWMGLFVFIAAFVYMINTQTTRDVLRYTQYSITEISKFNFAYGASFLDIPCQMCTFSAGLGIERNRDGLSCILATYPRVTFWEIFLCDSELILHTVSTTLIQNSKSPSRVTMQDPFTFWERKLAGVWKPKPNVWYLQ